MSDELAVSGNARKFVQLACAYAILEGTRRVSGFESAVLLGLAMNSADLNEARERLAGYYD